MSADATKWANYYRSIPNNVTLQSSFGSDVIAFLAPPIAVYISVLAS